jgi:hypothetical protein
MTTICAHSDIKVSRCGITRYKLINIVRYGCHFLQFYPPRLTLTERNLPSQMRKVFIVTRGASGIGYHLVAILFQAGGKVYIAGRSEDKAQQSIEEIKAGVQDLSSVG